MFKKISLSLAGILSVVALATPPSAMAADRDDYRRGDDRRVVVVHDDHRDFRNYWVGDDYYRWDAYHHHYVVERHVDRRFHVDRDHDGDRR